MTLGNGGTPVLFNEAVGGTITEVADYNGTGETWRIHTFTGYGSKTFTVIQDTQPFTVIAWGGGGAGSYHFEAFPQPTGGAGGSFVHSAMMQAGERAIVVGRGQGAKSEIMYGGWPGTDSTIETGYETLRAGRGQGGGGAASHSIHGSPDPAGAGNPAEGAGRSMGQTNPLIDPASYGLAANTARGGAGQTGGDKIADNGIDGAVIIAYRVG